jgi:hypothetical protein
MDDATQAEFYRAVEVLLHEYRMIGEPTENLIAVLNESPSATAKIIACRKELDPHFITFVRSGLEHLTIEHLVTDSRFLTLFTITERAGANSRIRRAKENF